MAALPSLRQLRYFVAIAQELNFTRAAEVCFVGQSTLSAGLKELEDGLGIRLVERDRQNVAITPIGLEILERAKTILASSLLTQELCSLVLLQPVPRDPSRVR